MLFFALLVTQLITHIFVKISHKNLDDHQNSYSFLLNFRYFFFLLTFHDRQQTHKKIEIIVTNDEKFSVKIMRRRDDNIFVKKLKYYRIISYF